MDSLQSRLTRMLESILALCLLVIAATVVTLVVLRYFFNSSIPGANEFVTIVFAYATSVGAAVIVGKREHIAISFATDSLPASLQAAVERLSLILVAFLNAILVMESVGWIEVTGDYLMPSTGLPRRVAQMSVPLGCGIAVFYCVLLLLSDRARSLPSSEAEE